MARGAIETLQVAGRRVPDDVRVIGFDDSSLGALSRPALTSVRQPIGEVAAEMARILLDTVADPGRRVTSTICEPTLRIRDSPRPRLTTRNVRTFARRDDRICGR